MHGLLRRTRVHVLEAVHQRIDLVLGHQVGLADKDLVGKTDLTPRFLTLVKLLIGVLGIDQGQDGVEQIAFGNFIVHEEGLRDRARIGQAGGFYHHAVELQFTLAALFGQIMQRGAQVFADGAADAAVVHLDDVLGDVGHQNLVVDVFFAKLVFDHRNFLTMGLGQHALEQRGLARAQKAGQDGGGDKAHVLPRKSGSGLRDCPVGQPLRSPANSAGGECSGLVQAWVNPGLDLSRIFWAESAQSAQAVTF